MHYLILLHILLSILVGILGMNRRFGFWGYFFASLALTPFVGLLMVFASAKRNLKRREDD